MEHASRRFLKDGTYKLVQDVHALHDNVGYFTMIHIGAMAAPFEKNICKLSSLPSFAGNKVVLSANMCSICYLQSAF